MVIIRKFLSINWPQDEKGALTAHIMEAVSPALNYSDDVLNSALVCSAEEVYAEFQQCLRESGTLWWSNTSRIAESNNALARMLERNSEVDCSRLK
jgi:hypothetical protein